MEPRSSVGRVVLVVLDGLRAEAVSRLQLPNLTSLAREGASTFCAATVSPSVTAAAMTSIFTGVPPSTHGIGESGFGIPADLRRIRPLPQLLSRASLPTSVFAQEIPAHYRWLARSLPIVGGAAGTFVGRDSDAILDAAVSTLRVQSRGFIFLHWPEADRAGHQFGWDSSDYERAVLRMDENLGRLAELTSTRTGEAGGTLLIVCSDHGGGGVDPRNHESDHPLDTTIPIVLHGGGVMPSALHPGVSLLDLPPTVLWALRVTIPESWSGRPLLEAFPAEVAAA